MIKFTAVLELFFPDQESMVSATYLCVYVYVWFYLVDTSYLIQDKVVFSDMEMAYVVYNEELMTRDYWRLGDMWKNKWNGGSDKVGKLTCWGYKLEGLKAEVSGGWYTSLLFQKVELFLVVSSKLQVVAIVILEWRERTLRWEGLPQSPPTEIYRNIRHIAELHL